MPCSSAPLLPSEQLGAAALAADVGVLLRRRRAHPPARSRPPPAPPRRSSSARLRCPSRNSRSRSRPASSAPPASLAPRAVTALAAHLRRPPRGMPERSPSPPWPSSSPPPLPFVQLAVVVPACLQRAARRPRATRRHDPRNAPPPSSTRHAGAVAVPSQQLSPCDGDDNCCAAPMRWRLGGCCVDASAILLPWRFPLVMAVLQLPRCAGSTASRRPRRHRRRRVSGRGGTPA
ncbi:vegetative cell wall protein gp1-like [Brachypodium distachyon]|uniref:vegetative cell wall protein gp1-like n=1 Tax=Brachypodium distachyon TaxID=15368 RepID=UPI000D0DE902|nr:vegetative cell wall protein gp1-like [Brachypodium distachyon]|eukprot:XP_024318530.1 vegetative cell wall protein gp1-like [Brachypodium distachyon]